MLRQRTTALGGAAGARVGGSCGWSIEGEAPMLLVEHGVKGGGYGGECDMQMVFHGKQVGSVALQQRRMAVLGRRGWGERGRGARAAGRGARAAGTRCYGSVPRGNEPLCVGCAPFYDATASHHWTRVAAGATRPGVDDATASCIALSGDEAVRVSSGGELAWVYGAVTFEVGCRE